MSHARKTLRAAVRSALATDLPGIDWRPRWWDAVSLDGGAAPVGAVITPLTRTALDSVGAVTRTTQLVVMVKLTGGADLPDEMDDQAALIEASVLAALANLSTLYTLAEETTDITGDVRSPVGELSMTFEAQLRTAEGDQTIII